MDRQNDTDPADGSFPTISAALTQGGTSSDIAWETLREAIRITGATQGRFYVLDAELRHLHCLMVYPDQPLDGEQIDIDDPACSLSPLVYCLRDDKPVLIPDTTHYSGFSYDIVHSWNTLPNDKKRRTRALIFLPLRDYSGQAVGVLVIQYPDALPSLLIEESQKTHLARLAKHAASTVAAARLADENRLLRKYPHRKRDIKTEKTTHQQNTQCVDAFSPLLGNSAPIRAARSLAERAAPTMITVMLLGETGTGKDVMAQAIHNASPRASKPFVAQNCAAIPHDMLEGELFGWEKGAFSGAHTARTGLLSYAHGGTLFLDEIGDMPLTLQAKLLRVLQERKVRALGACEERSVDIRIIVATHRDLRSMVDEGTFRADLYYRLAVFPIHLAPLRDRLDDLECLVRHFVGICQKQLGSSIRDVDPSVLRSLARHSWPGNVRELRNVVERNILMAMPDAERWITSPEFPPREHRESPSSPPGWPDLIAMPLKEAMEHVEARLISHHLGESKGNLLNAATRLGVPRRTLADKIKRNKIITETSI